MPTSPSSSVQAARQALASRLREIRQDAELTARALARAARWHESKCSRIENARTVPSVDDIRVWCELCNAVGQIDDLVASLRAVDSMYVEWRRMERTGLRRLQESRLPLYERTRHFRIYEGWVVPALLQTSTYTTTILKTITSFRGIPDDVDEAVAARVDRQRVLTEGDHRFAVVLEEAVLRSRLGGVETMAGQLGHLLTVATLPSVSLGVIPMSADRTRWPVESFYVFDDERVNVELMSAWLTITQPSEVGIYVRAFAELSSQAVYGAAARTLITAAIRALG